MNVVRSQLARVEIIQSRHFVLLVATRTEIHECIVLGIVGGITYDSDL